MCIVGSSLGKDRVIAIDVGKEFSPLPHGRYHWDSPDCAEALMIMIQDALDYTDHVNVRFENLSIAAVGSSFLDHLACMLVVNHCTRYVTVTSDCEWTSTRWNKYLSAYKDKHNKGRL